MHIEGRGLAKPRTFAGKGTTAGTSPTEFAPGEAARHRANTETNSTAGAAA